MVKSGEKSISMNKRELGTWGWWPHQMLRSPQLIGADIDPTGFLSPCVEYVLMLPTSNWEYGAYGAVAELLSIMWLQPWSVAGLGQFKNGVDVVGLSLFPTLPKFITAKFQFHTCLFIMELAVGTSGSWARYCTGAAS